MDKRIQDSSLGQTFRLKYNLCMYVFRLYLATTCKIEQQQEQQQEQEQEQEQEQQHQQQ